MRFANCTKSFLGEVERISLLKNFGQNFSVRFDAKRCNVKCL
eukprot:UN24808